MVEPMIAIATPLALNYAQNEGLWVANIVCICKPTFNATQPVRNDLGTPVAFDDINPIS